MLLNMSRIFGILLILAGLFQAYEIRYPELLHLKPEQRTAMYFTSPLAIIAGWIYLRKSFLRSSLTDHHKRLTSGQAKFKEEFAANRSFSGWMLTCPRCKMVNALPANECDGILYQCPVCHCTIAVQRDGDTVTTYS